MLSARPGYDRRQGSGPQTRAECQRLPKVDLHRHLEGSLRLATLAEIAAEHGVPLAELDLGRLRPLVQMVDDRPSFHAFLAKFDLLRRFYSTREAIERVAREAVLDAGADGVHYLELRFSPFSLAEARRFRLEDVVESVIAGVRAGEARSGTITRLLMTVVRDSPPPLSEVTVDLALQYRNDGVVGVDLAGDETRFPARTFAPAFKRARAGGLGITVHAGEVADPDAIGVAIRELEADRIGHGVQAYGRPEIVGLLRRTGTPLEMCPTSNLQTGAVAGLRQHPLVGFHRDGLRVTINTDNPSVSNTTLTDEYHIVVRELSATHTELRHMILTAVDVAFLPSDEKRALKQWFVQKTGCP